MVLKMQIAAKAIYLLKNHLINRQRDQRIYKHIKKRTLDQNHRFISLFSVNIFSKPFMTLINSIKNFQILLIPEETLILILKPKTKIINLMPQDQKRIKFLKEVGLKKDEIC